METTKNKMTPFEKNFFHSLKVYLDTKLYFYGSIQRDDYFHGYSDIDVDIFTDNENSTIAKLQNFLNVDRDNFEKFVYKLYKTNKLVNGYKIQYKDNTHNFSTEISIYNNKYKKNVLIEHNFKVNLPFYILISLIIIKSFYYNLGILPKNLFIFIKTTLINFVSQRKDVEFIKTDIPNKKSK